MQNKSMKYYEAYEERYKTAHERGVSWAYENSTPIVMDTITKYKIQKTHSVLEIGCGEGRDGFYQFILNHLNANGMALICTMGDGNSEMKSDINRAFEVQERNHESGKMMVAATSCRMVSFSTFEAELARNRFKIIEKGITSALPDFNNLMYAVVERS